MPVPAPIAALTARLRPEGAEVVDAHTHLGRDEDGMELAPGDLLAQLDAAGASLAWTFPLHDPERVPAYRVPNDRVLAWAGDAGGRLAPFCRLDPGDSPVAEAERCLARGARGIKLHPRAQAFVFAEGVADGIFALAEEARVPVLIHAGRGMPPIAEGLAAAALRHPGLVLVLAHAGIADQALFAHLLRDHPGVLYDTSVLHAMDLRTLLARVPAERVLHASDAPYGDAEAALFVTLRACAAAGLDEARVRAVLGATARSALAGGPLPPASPPVGDERVALPGPLLRLHHYLCAAFGALMSGSPSGAAESVGLARAVCNDPRAGSAAEELELCRDLLDEAAEALRGEAGAGGIAAVFAAARPMHLALTVAATAVC